MQLKSLEKCEKYVFLLQNIYPDAFKYLPKKKLYVGQWQLYPICSKSFELYTVLLIVCVRGGGSTIYARSI